MGSGSWRLAGTGRLAIEHRAKERARLLMRTRRAWSWRCCG